MHKDFFVSSNHIWMNAASEGPLLKCAHEALEEAVRWKSEPHLLADKWAKVPAELKRSLGRLMHVNAADVILGTSASYGWFILANSYPWQKGDEILLMENDFPSNILPWLALEKQGVVVKQLKPAQQVLSVEEIQNAVTDQTKWVCLSHVHTFTGASIDIPAVAKFLRSKEIHCAVNISQSLGNCPVDVSSWDVDAVVGVGYKWLCGPYGTGFAWIHPDVRRTLDYNHPYWPNYLTEEELQQEGPLVLKDLKGARTLDVFGTANFFNFVPLRAAIDFWLSERMEKVARYIDTLGAQFTNELDRDQYDILSPENARLIVISKKDQKDNKALYAKLLENKIHTAYWKHHIRLSPHTYNTPEQIQHILQILHHK